MFCQYLYLCFIATCNLISGKRVICQSMYALQVLFILCRVLHFFLLLDFLMQALYQSRYWRRLIFFISVDIAHEPLR